MSATICIHVHSDGTCHTMEAGPRDGSAGFSGYDSLIVALVRMAPISERLALIQEAIVVARRLGSTTEEIDATVATARQLADAEEAEWAADDEGGDDDV